MAGPSSFVYVVDRYLEVSNVYHQRMDRWTNAVADKSASADRLDKLLDKVQKVEPTEWPTPLTLVEPGDVGGQAVATTPDFVKDAERFQQDVLKRYTPDTPNPPGSTPQNIEQLRGLLRLGGLDYLGSFPSPTYAFDILTELASISVCPDARNLEARDMVHMHAVELELHLAKVIAQARLLSPGTEIELGSCLSVHDLRALEHKGQLAAKLVEFAVPRDPANLLSELVKLAGPESVQESLKLKSKQVLRRLEQEALSFPDSLQENEKTGAGKALNNAVHTCEDMVVFGLVAAYAAWYSVARESPEEAGALRTSALFCTRILLDEGRWGVCRRFAEAARDIVSAVNENGREVDDPRRGVTMITANWFFARQKLNEDIRNEVEAWDVSGVNPRYAFLKQVLLGNFREAAELAFNLVEINPKTGRPSLCAQEIDEWPILKDFRESQHGKRVLAACTGR